jgi:hypothetical protein
MNGAAYGRFDELISGGHSSEMSLQGKAYDVRRSSRSQSPLPPPAGLFFATAPRRQSQQPTPQMIYEGKKNRFWGYESIFGAIKCILVTLKKIFF